MISDGIPVFSAHGRDNGHLVNSCSVFCVVVTMWLMSVLQENTALMLVYQYYQLSPSWAVYHGDVINFNKTIL